MASLDHKTLPLPARHTQALERIRSGWRRRMAVTAALSAAVFLTIALAG